MGTFLALLALALLPDPARAAGGEFAPSFDLGVVLHSGTSGKSLTGVLGYVGSFRAESRKGFFRPYCAFELGSDVGKASVGENEPQATAFHGGFVGGVQLFPFSASKLTPFLGGGGILAWSMMKMGSPPEGVEPNTQSVTFGFEMAAGVDIRGSAGGGNALRLRSSYYFASGSLAGVSGFQLSGFRFTIGMVW
jgi:hypothetical protein